MRKFSEKVLKWDPERKQMKICCEKVLNDNQKGNR